MTPRRAKWPDCIVCRERPAEPESIKLNCLCQPCIDDKLKHWTAGVMSIIWAARRARTFERKHATKAAHAEAMRNVYQHYKGGEYRRLLPDVVRMERPRGAANHDNVKMVVYACMKTGIVWVRPLTEWTELVTWPDGVIRTRFVLKRNKPTKEKP